MNKKRSEKHHDHESGYYEGCFSDMRHGSMTSYQDNSINNKNSNGGSSNGFENSRTSKRTNNSSSRISQTPTKMRKTDILIGSTKSNHFTRKRKVADIIDNGEIGARTFCTNSKDRKKRYEIINTSNTRSRRGQTGCTDGSSNRTLHAETDKNKNIQQDDVNRYNRKFEHHKFDHIKDKSTYRNTNACDSIDTYEPYNLTANNPRCEDDADDEEDDNGSSIINRNDVIERISSSSSNGTITSKAISKHQNNVTDRLRTNENNDNSDNESSCSSVSLHAIDKRTKDKDKVCTDVITKNHSDDGSNSNSNNSCKTVDNKSEHDDSSGDGVVDNHNSAKKKEDKSDSVVCTGSYSPLDMELEEVSRIRTKGELRDNFLNFLLFEILTHI